MKITPRANEVDPVVAILESDEYADAKAMAKAIIRQVATSLAERDWYVYTHRFGDLVVPWGPLASEAEVKKFAKTLGLGGKGLGIKVYSSERVLEHIEANATATLKLCGECSHVKGVHEHPKMGMACAVYGCHCKRYEAASIAA